jgi:hypothetical protein
MAEADGQAKKLTAKQTAFLAAYLGEARFNATQAARLAGYRGSDQTLGAIGHENLKKPEIQGALQEWRDEIRESAITTVEYRIDRLRELEQRLWTVVDERAKLLANDPESGGGETGVIVKQYKVVGGGENAQFVTEYVFDQSVTRELRAIYDDVAKEKGHRVEKSETKIDATDQYLAALKEFGRGRAGA